MTSGHLILGKLHAWATRKQIPTREYKGGHGPRYFTLTPEDNLFEGSLSDPVRAAFSTCAGDQLTGEWPKISAIHSSSALAVNLFAYWLNKGDLPTLAGLLGIPGDGIQGASFEDCFPVVDGWKARTVRALPQMELTISYANGARVGIECKLFDPYRRQGHASLGRGFLTLGRRWDDIPRCHALARLCAGGASGFDRLGVSELLRHILGLKYGARDGSFQLIYLYLDAPGREGDEHRRELERFQETIKGDPVHFVPLSVQEFILRLCERARAEHAPYVDYLSERYL